MASILMITHTCKPDSRVSAQSRQIGGEMAQSCSYWAGGAIRYREKQNTKHSGHTKLTAETVVVVVCAVCSTSENL